MLSKASMVPGVRIFGMMLKGRVRDVVGDMGLSQNGFVSSIRGSSGVVLFQYTPIPISSSGVSMLPAG